MDETNNKSAKRRAALLLRRYDRLRKEIRTVERDLTEAVTLYGKANGYWGLSKDHFRTRLHNEERIRSGDVPGRGAWERANA
jgi:type II secretory pathway component PulJ